jgi:hypothetical protein
MRHITAKIAGKTLPTLTRAFHAFPVSNVNYTRVVGKSASN